jgi:hypothetical protein
MGNRIIKESICTSESIERLNEFQEIFFYRLIVNCDDYGCMDARLKILISRLFPLRGIDDDQVKDALEALITAGLVTLYTVRGKPFLQINSWERHQQVRTQKRKYPGPDEADAIADDINCNQMISNDIRCNQAISNDILTHARAESESNPNPNTNPNPTRARAREEASDDRFDIFWNEYPRRVSRKDAEKAWKKLKPDEQLFAVIMENLRKQKKCDDWKRDDGQYIPYPATWLNGQRWEDEVKQHYRKVQVSAQDYGQRDYDAEYWAEYEAREQREIEEKIRRMEEEKSALLSGKEEADAMVLGGSGERDHPAGDMGLPVLPVAGTA